MPFSLTKLRCNIADDPQQFDDEDELLDELRFILSALDEDDEVQILLTPSR